LDGIAAWKHLLKGDKGFFIAIVKAHVHFVKWLLFVKNQKPAFGIKKTQLTGRYQGSVVWKHFVKKKNAFSEIINDK
jgi:hypothetical protein